jgi:hypothetical protein
LRFSGSGVKPTPRLIRPGRPDDGKWCFLFWIGQIVAVASIVDVMLRLMR